MTHYDLPRPVRRAFPGLSPQTFDLIRVAALLNMFAADGLLFSLAAPQMPPAEAPDWHGNAASAHRAD